MSPHISPSIHLDPLFVSLKNLSKILNFEQQSFLFFFLIAHQHPVLRHSIRSLTAPKVDIGVPTMMGTQCRSTKELLLLVFLYQTVQNCR